MQDSGNKPPPPPTSSRTLVRFFVPLAIQAASQALCYPLVAMVASRGPGGPVNLAGLAQANIVMFFFGMFALSYVTTGMVFAKTREGYQKFKLVTLLTGLTVIIIQAILCTPTLAHLIFGEIISLPPCGYFLTGQKKGPYPLGRRLRLSGKSAKNST